MSSFVGYFFVPGHLGGLKSASGDNADILIRLIDFLKENLFFVQISTFSPGVSQWFLAENDQIFKSALFTCLCPQGSRRVVKLPWKSMLSANNAMTTNFLFNSQPDFIFCWLFLCPWSLGRPKKCLRGRFRTY